MLTVRDPYPFLNIPPHCHSICGLSLRVPFATYRSSKSVQHLWPGFHRIYFATQDMLHGSFVWQRYKSREVHSDETYTYQIQGCSAPIVEYGLCLRQWFRWKSPGYSDQRDSIRSHLDSYMSPVSKIPTCPHAAVLTI